jgi:hypothetical protein
MLNARMIMITRMPQQEILDTREHASSHAYIHHGVPKVEHMPLLLLLSV